MAINLIYRWSLLRAYQYGDFGQVYPIVRGLPPLLVVLFAALWFGELLPFGGLLGVALISLGVLSLLQFRTFQSGQGRAPAYAAVAGVCVALYTVIDASGVRGSDNVLQYVVYFTLAMSVPIPLLAWLRRGPLLLRHARQSWRLSLFGGLNYTLSYALVLLAMTLDSVAKTAALRESSVIIAALIATWLFKEPFGLRRLIAAGLVTSGILLIKLLG